MPGPTQAWRRPRAGELRSDCDCHPVSRPGVRHAVGPTRDAELSSNGKANVVKLVSDTFRHASATRHALANFLCTDPPLSLGEKCAAFEQSFAAKQERKYAVCVNSGSSANLV